MRRFLFASNPSIQKFRFFVDINLKTILYEKTVTFIHDWNGNKTERKELKSGTYHRYFETWDIAHDFIIKIAINSVKSAERNLEHSKENLDKYKSMVKPLYTLPTITE